MTTRRITQQEAAQWQREIAPEAFRQIIQPSTIPISRVVNGQLDQFGSCVLLEIADKCLIVSAAHVLDRAAFHGDRICLPRSPEPSPPLMLDKAGYLVSEVPPGRRATDPQMREDDPFDVGVCELHADDANELKKHFRFLRLHQVDGTVPFVPAAYMTAGYPSKLVDRGNDGHQLLPTPFFAVTELCGQSPEEARHVRPDSLFLSFQRDGYDQQFQEIVAPKLGGISGGGMWRLANPARLISMWKVDDVKLVGIETSCFYGKYIRGISTECVLALIGSQWPELKSSILMAHGRIEFGLQLHRRPG